MRALDFAVSRLLPEDLRRDTYDLSKKGMTTLMAEVATRYPERYAEIVKRLGDLGRNAAWWQGYTTTASDTRQVIDTGKYYAQMDAELAHLKKQKLSQEEFEDRRSEIYLKYSDIIEKATVTATKQNGNAFALAVASGARGNDAHIKAIVSTPGVYQDAKGRIIPLFVRNSFGDGVRPAETLAGTYGARTAVTSTKRATAQGGDLLKIMTQSTLNYNVTEKDCGVGNGLVMQPDAESLSGRVLARDTDVAPAGTVIDRKLLAHLRRANKPVVARSAMTCRAKHGLCAKCVGLQADGQFPNIGNSVGVTAAAAIGEPIVQNALNVKHNSGMAKGKKSFSGLKYVQQFVQIPDDFKDRAAVAEVDGVVERIDKAPQGGYFITVNGTRHFVNAGFEPTVQLGQKVEAGEMMSDGLANPSDIVRLRGLGEGRKYYADRLSQMLADSGQKPDPRNVEILARAAVDNYMVDDPDEDDPWNADDLVRENELLSYYKPPEDTRELSLDKAGGKYLQSPMLHYTVGTRLTPRMLDSLREVGIDRVPVSSQTPRFHPEMKRLRVASHDTEDWMVSLGTSYLSGQMRTALERGDETNIKENWHYGPRLAYGVGFGENVETTGKF